MIFKLINLSEAEKILKEMMIITAQSSVGLEILQPLQDEMESFLSQLNASESLYDDRDAWLKVCNAYMLAYYRVMLRVSELLERNAA